MTETLQVWILDDEPIVADAQRALLRAAFPGVRVQVFARVDEVLSALSDDRSPHLLVADLRMVGTEGEMGGAQAVRAARERHPDLPIVVHTAWPREATALMGDVVGVTVLAKGDPDTFLQHVRSLMAVRGFTNTRLLTAGVDGRYVADLPPLLSRGWQIGGLAAAAGVWAATLLPVTSGMSRQEDGIAILFCILGGAIIGTSRVMQPAWARALATFFGCLIIMAASILVPLLRFS